MFGRRRLKAEIVRLSYRVSELEERLCPCESHSWVMLDSDFTIGSSAGDIDTIYRYKCRRCGKTLKTYKLLPTESYTGSFLVRPNTFLNQKSSYLCVLVEPARRYSNPEDHRAAGLCRPQNCRIKQKSPGGCRGSLSLSCICWLL